MSLEERFILNEVSVLKEKRNYNQLVNDIIACLESDLTVNGKYDVIDEVIWKWTEMSGKIIGCKYWSVNALKELEANYSNVVSGKVKLIHEHVVPRNYLIKRILNISSAISKEEAIIILNKFVLGCVITKDENRRLSTVAQKTLPDQFVQKDSQFYLDPWVRYRLGKINVNKIDWSNPRDPKVESVIVETL